MKDLDKVNQRIAALEVELAAMRAGGEPVAWAWNHSRVKEVGPVYMPHPEKSPYLESINATGPIPLYTHPQPAAPAQSGVRQFTDDERQFTKKPVTIQAIQWTGRNLREVIAFTDGPPDTRSAHAGMAWDAYVDLVARDGLKIYTLEGKMSAAVGDWIIKGVQGEHYPCKPDIFEATYSRAALAAPAQQPWQYTPPAQERIDALELEVRQLTEQIAELRHAPTPQADSQPAPVMEDTPPPCDQELFDQGVSVGLFDIPKWTAEALCRGIAAATEARVDWHYLGGRVHIKALPAARAPADSVLEDAAQLERERICAAIKAEDDYCVEHGDYMLDSDDCIKIVRGEWVRPDYLVDAARKQAEDCRRLVKP